MPTLRAPGAAAGAAPIDDAALLERATQYTLPSGRVIWWLPPDELEMLAFTGTLPSDLTAAVYQMLRDEGAIEDEDDPRSYHRDLNQIKAEYQIAQFGMVKPKFDASRAIGDGEVWGRRDLSREDRRYIYWWLFRLNTTPEALAAAAADQPGRPAQPAPDRDDLPPDAGAAAAD